MKQQKLKEKFYEDRAKVFNNSNLLKDSFKFCATFSVLVEEYIFKALKELKLNCAVASVGSFARRELSPHSDIDLMFIFDKVDNNEQLIKDAVIILWDVG